jgi:hypothetical protein
LTRSATPVKPNTTGAKDFLTEIQRAGGIKPTGDIRQSIGRAYSGKTPRGLYNPDGLTEEQALNLGVRNGWIPDKGNNVMGVTNNDFSDLYDALERGRQPHPETIEKAITARDYRNNLETEADKRGVHYYPSTANHELEDALKQHDMLNFGAQPEPDNASYSDDIPFKKGGLASTKITHPQWVSFVKNHGKKYGFTMKDKSNPKAIEVAVRVIKKGVA